MVDLMMGEIMEEVVEDGEVREEEEIGGGEETKVEMVVTKGFGWREQYGELWWIEGEEA